MWNVSFLFFLLWYGFWFVAPTVVSEEQQPSFDVLQPTLKRNCSGRRVECIDDCSFLCVENGAKCLGGQCVVSSSQIECDRDKGGIVLLARDPVEHWKCLCTDPTFWTGEDCSELSQGVCENGIFIYRGLQDKTCLCHFPFRKLVLHDVPYCVDPTVMNFFRE